MPLTDEEKRELKTKLNRLIVKVSQEMGMVVDEITDQFIGPALPKNKSKPRKE